MHNIVILGGNFAGVSTAHHLLRHVLPSLKTSNSTYKITLISPSDHTYFCIAAPRTLVAEEIPIEKPFANIPAAFEAYDPAEFTFLQGEAIGVDESQRTVAVKIIGREAHASIPYDSLIIATGAKTTSPLWTLHGPHANTISAVQKTRARIVSAKTILIAGGGPVGVETAGEIAARYHDKDITLLSGHSRLLPRLQNRKPGSMAEQKLAALLVRTVHNLRVLSGREVEDGMFSLSFSDGTARSVDLYIDATGSRPSTSFLPSVWCDAVTHKVVTDTSSLRAMEAPAGVYAIGDAASYSAGGVAGATLAIPALGYSIWEDLKESATKEGLFEGKGDADRKNAPKRRKYEPFTRDMQVVPIGPKGGVGALFGWSVPSWVVWLMKSRTFMFEKAAGLATGDYA